MSPKFGAIDGGTRVVVTGIGFVNFGGVVCSFDGVENPGELISTTEVVCVTPPSIANGARGRDVPVFVTLNGLHYGANTGGWSEEIFFEYADVPVVSFISPTTGPPVASTIGNIQDGENQTTLRYLTVHGAHFVDGVGLACRFGTLLTKATYLSVSEVECRIPASSMATGNAPIVAVTTNGVDFSRQGSSSATFTYVRAPELLGLSPKLGPVSGGTIVTIIGAGFGTDVGVLEQASLLCRWEVSEGQLKDDVDSGLSIGLWDVNAAVESESVATCLSPMVTPAIAKRSYAVVRISSDGGRSFSTTALRFLYYPEVAISSVVPATVPASGGRDIMVSGHGFLPGEDLLLCFFTETDTIPSGHTDKFPDGSSSIEDSGAFTTVATWLSTELLQCDAPVLEMVKGTVRALEVRVTNNGVDASMSACPLLVYSSPQISRLFPNAGPRSGGTVVTLELEGWGLPVGTDRIGAVRCQWGTTAVAGEISTDHAVTSGQLMVTCISPMAGTATGADILTGKAAQADAVEDAYPAEEVMVTLHIDGRTANIAGVPFWYHTVPVVLTASPPAGVETGGTEVILEGSGFNFAAPGERGFGGAVCMFGSATAPAVVVSDSELRCRSLRWVGSDVSITGTAVGLRVSLNGGVDFSASSVPFHYLPVASTTGERLDRGF